jgi:signal peptidase I
VPRLRLDPRRPPAAARPDKVLVASAEDPRDGPSVAPSAAAAAPPVLVATRRPKHKVSQVDGDRAGARPAGRPSGDRKVARHQAKLRFELLAIVLIASTVVAPLVALWSPGHAFVIASDSMGNSIPKGSLVFAGPASVEVGDVIVYDAATGVREVHRVQEELTMADGSVGYRTKGDANPAADSYIVASSDVVGEVRGHAPLLGYLWMVPAVWQAVLFGGMVVAYVAITLWDARGALGRLRGASLVVGVLLVLVLPGFDAAVLGSIPDSTQTAAVATPPLPFSSGSWGTTTTANGGNTASVSLTTPKLWKEVQLWGCTAGTSFAPSCSFIPLSLSYSTLATSTPPNLALADTAALDGTVQYYLEATMAAGSGTTVSVQLYDVTSAAAVSGAEVSTASTTATTVRSSAFTLSNAHDVQWQSKVGSLLVSSSITSVKLLSAQQFPTKTQTAVPISGAGQSAAASTAFGIPVGATKWLYETASLDGTVTVNLEAVMDSSSALATTSLQLVDRTSASTVTTLTTTSTSAARVRSGSLTLTNGHEYEVELKTSSALATAHLYEARMLLTQTSFTKTLRYEDLSFGHTTTSTSFTTVGAGGRHNAATEWGSLSATFEATLRNSGAGTTSLQLFDTTGSAVVSGSTLTLTSSTASRQRASVALLNNDPGTYAAQLKASANTAEVRTAWLIVAQADGKTYDHAIKSSNNVAGSCAWSFTAALTGNTGIAKLTAAKVQLTGDSGTVDQVVVSGGAATQTVGSAVTTAYGNSVKVVVQSRPSASGTIDLTLDLQGTCSGVHTLQPFVLTLQ